MNAAALLAALRATGRTVTLTAQSRIEVRPRLTDELRPTVIAHRPELIAALEAESYCHRCRLPHDRLILAYWSTTERFCGPCCEAIAAELDERRTWPTPPWIIDQAAELDADRLAS